MHFYDVDTKAYGYVCFVGLTDKQKDEVVEFMKKVPLSRLDWPGTDVISTVQSLKRRGYAQMLPDSYPLVVDLNTTFLLCKAHMTEAMKKTSNPVDAFFSPDQSMGRGMDRRVTSEEDWPKLFDSFLSHCEVSSVQHAFQTGTNKDGYWGFEAPVAFDLKKIFVNVVTVGSGDQFTHDCSQKGGIGRVLSNLFRTME